ncbi:MAG: protein-L-isoaspartate(D-aspartate) O-methyltransferase [Chloroflexi bacterium]|jgi:protein-L-isoaspartate(D-aspartate) O-methyltransferase|nr:protein-L-isoaspartate(D-aspartate) O-methyltransferase [Chloroflexota bacterium]
MPRYDLAKRGIRDPRVLQAMDRVPRHLFVDARHQAQAYNDHPLPIGYGQTISQPYMVAVMTELLQLDPQARVLEIGTGSGFQTAVLAELAGQVFSVEQVLALHEVARERLAGLGYRNVELRYGDGYHGWPEHAPYDAIIVTCAPDHVPAPLVEQLANEGRMVLPVGAVGREQRLVLVTRRGEHIQQRDLMAVAFVPLTGGHEQIPY